MSNTCPNCSGPLPQDAVLCVQCGYHLPSGTILATQIERPKEVDTSPMVDANPYAAPNMEAAAPRRALGGKAVLDLTEEGAREANLVVKAAESLWPLLALAFCLCAIAWIPLCPFYIGRLMQWYSLHERYAELRNPNSLSTHAAITVKFPDALPKLWIGAVVSTILALVVVFVIARSFGF